MPLRTDARLPALVWLAALLLLGAYVFSESIGRTTHGFIAYYAASRLLASGRLDPRVYDDAWFMEYVRGITGTSVREIFGPNPPTMALLALPVVFVGPSGARTIWLIASLLCLAAASAVLIRHGLRQNEPAPAVFVAVLLLSPAVLANLRTGQAYLFVFTAFAAAGLCLVRGRDALAGSLIGLIILLKSSGLPLVLLLVFRRRWRAAIAAALVCAVGLLILLSRAGAGIWTRYVAYAWEFVQRPSASVTAYQTTRGLIRHLCISDPQWNPVAAMECAAVASVLPALLIGGAVVVTIVLSRRSSTESWLAAGVCLSVLTMPVAEEHQFASMGVPMMFLLQSRTRRAKKGRAPSWWPWIAFAILFLMPLEVTAQRFTAGWTALAAYPRLYAAWLLWGVNVWEMVKERQDRGRCDV